MPAHEPRTAVRAGRGRIDVRTAVVVWGVTWVAGQVLFQLVASTSGDTPDDATLPIATLAVGVVATWCAYLAGLWWASDRAGSGNFVADYGLEFQPIDIVGVPIGLLTQLVLVPLVYLPLRAWWPDTFSDDRLEETARDLVDRADGATVVVLVLVVVVGAPIVEELVYRGLAAGLVRRRGSARCRRCWRVRRGSRSSTSDRSSTRACSSPVSCSGCVRSRPGGSGCRSSPMPRSTRPVC